MRFEVGCIEGDRRMVRGFGSQTRYYPHQHPHITPPLPTVVDGLVGAILSRCISPAQAVVIDEDNAGENTPVVDKRYAMAIREIWPQPLHLTLAQPI